MRVILVHPTATVLLEAPKPTPSPEIPKRHRVYTNFSEKYGQTFAFFPVPCQEPNRDCSEKLVQMNFLILGGLLGADFPPLKQRRRGRAAQQIRISQRGVFQRPAGWIAAGGCVAPWKPSFSPGSEASVVYTLFGPMVNTIFPCFPRNGKHHSFFLCELGVGRRTKRRWVRPSKAPMETPHRDPAEKGKLKFIFYCCHES